MKFDTDIAIVGGGIFGLTTAWACIKRGFRVTVIDSAKIGSGSSGGVIGTLSPNVPETWSIKKQYQLDALLSAEAFWSEIQHASGLKTGYGRTGRIIPIMNERGLELAQIRHEDAKKLWMGQARWDIHETAKYGTWVSGTSAPCGVIYEDLSARINPSLACTSLSLALQKAGCVLQENWPVKSIKENVVEGPLGQISATNVIIAAGVGSFPLLSPYIGPDYGLGVKGQAALFEGANMQGAPIIFANGVYIIAHENGTVGVGSTSENTWDDPFETDEKLDHVLEKAFDICPKLRNASVIKRWANLRPRGKKPDPIIGKVPTTKSIYVATGGFKIGFGIAHEIGKNMADILAGETPDIPEAFFVRL